MTDIFKKEESKEDDKPLTGDKPAEGVQDGTSETYLSLILNENGEQKYATAEEALKGSVHAQSHIANLEKELKVLREEGDKSASMEKIIEALDKSKTPDKDDTTSNGITQEQLTDAVTQLLDKRENVSSQKHNVATVTDTFVELYGEKASETMYGKAKDLGFSIDEINRMIATNPKAALKVLGVEEVKKADADITTGSQGINTDGFQNKGEPEKESSMGYITADKLTENWKRVQAEVNKKYGIETP